VSRTLFELALRRARTDAPRLDIGPTLMDPSRWPFDYTKRGWQALVLSLAVIGAGGAAIATRGLPLGIDFTGGTLLIAEFSVPGVTEDAVRAAVSPLPGEAVVQRYGAVQDRRFLIRVPVSESGDGNETLATAARSVTGALDAAKLPPFHIVDRELVSAAIGADLQRRGIQATLASIAAIAVYIGVRFRAGFAAGAIVATLHDVLVTIAALALAGYDLTLTVTAALLTVIGYSVNDTIVVFDRVRENARAMRTLPLPAVVNLSVNQTLSRTVITAGTTVLSVLALFLFGGEALAGFAFTLLVGIMSGTYSTVFIASAMATRWSNPTAEVGGRRSAVRRAESPGLRESAADEGTRG
jgi:preprotein translocase subunit SecF